MKIFPFVCRLVIILSALFSVTAFAQLDPAFTVELPYAQQQVASMKFGGIVNTMPAKIPSPQRKSANQNYFTQHLFYIGFAGEVNNVKLKDISTSTGTTEHKTWSQIIAPTFLSISWPVRLLQHSWIISGSYSRWHQQELDAKFIQKMQDRFIGISRKGTIYSANFDMGMALSKNLSLGFGAEKWFGRIEWSSMQFVTEMSSGAHTRDNFSGHSWHTGFSMQIGQLHLASTLYSPFALSHGDGMQDMAPSPLVKYRREYYGALDIGLIWSIPHGPDIGLGFYLQNHAKIKYYDNNNYLDFIKYKNIPRLSLGIEDETIYKSFRIGHYLGYSIVRHYKVTDFLMPLFAQQIVHQSRNKDDYQHDLVAGLDVLKGAIGVHLNAHYRANNYQLAAYSAVPPWS
jgi:hypothetical protein